MTNKARNIDVQRHDTGNTVEENMQERKVNVQTTVQPARNARKWITELECKQISKPRGDRNVNKINGSDSKEEYGEEEYNEVETKRITAKETRTHTPLGSHTSSEQLKTKVPNGSSH